MAFATWDSGQLLNVTLSGGNLTALCNSSAGGSVRGQGTNRTGKWYWEQTVNATGTLNTSTRSGVCTAVATPTSIQTSTLGLVTATAGGGIVVNGTLSSSTASAFNVAGNVQCVALDLDLGLIWFRTGSGNWNGSGAANPATGVGGVSIVPNGYGPAVDYYPLVSMGATLWQFTANFGATAFAQTAPSGFAGWTTGAQVDNAVVSRVGSEAWIVGQGTTSITRVGYEAWFSIVPASVVTRVGREVWFPAYTSGNTRKRRVCVISSG